MGIAASSALRDDTGANGPAYGSLEGLGGPRVLKKKPVLVLDPEELEAAHALFYEASAELLGEEVERAPRPVSILGLAPMEDDPEELGHSDEFDDDAEDDMPSPEAVLALTRRKSPLPELGYAEVDYAEDDLGEEGYAEEGYAEEGYALGDFEALANVMANGPANVLDGLPDDNFIDDGLDLSTRIFPSLPIQRELAQDDLEEFTFQPVELARPAIVAPLPTPPVAPPAPVARAPEPPALLPAPAPVEAEPPVEPPVEPIAPPERQEVTPPPPPPPAPDKPLPARFEELNPAADYDTPEEMLDLDRWLAWEEEEDTPPPAAHTEPEPAPPAPAPEVDHDSGDDEGYSFSSDDKVDGYAFMRDQRPRRAVLQAAQEGQQSALRAKLLRDAELEAAKAGRPEPKRRPLVSLLLRCWNWLRDLLR